MRISIMFMILLLGLLPSVFGEYILDVVFPECDRPISLNLGTNNAAKKDYDAFLTYPTEYEDKKPYKWDKLGLGRFVQASISNQASRISLTMKVKQVDLVSWKDYPIEDTFWRQPIVHAFAQEVTIQITLGEWLVLGETESKAGKSMTLKIRVRDSASQQTNAPYSQPAAVEER